MELSKKYPIRRFEADRFTALDDAVVNETRIELDVNDGQLRLAMLCLPVNIEALAVGFLMGEGALKQIDKLQAVEYLPSEQKVAIGGDFDADVLEDINNRWTFGSGCGGGGTSRDVLLPDHGLVGAGRTVTTGQLEKLAGEFANRMELWKRTGGVHACALADEGNLLLFAEDIGRHNAFDKVMGLAALGRIDTSDKIVLTTGRLSAEIVSKAVSCRVPMLVSRSAVTSLAVELARRSGLTLVGFCRGKRLNVYTGYQRVRPTLTESEGGEK